MAHANKKLGPCYWVVLELGAAAAAVARLIWITRSAETQATGRGEALANDQRYGLISPE
jgi:hypothetical protein